ncbi:MAG: hypothetical protein AAGF11_18275 [Myxococcota bacterium]
MSLDPEALDEHARTILRSRRIRGKLVVLCEGDRVAAPDHGKAPSPQTYRRHEQLPDANFYLSCVPRSWQNRKLPCFFNCGDRHDVLQTFARLPQLHDTSPTESYLDPGKLYAVVDLDLQPAPLSDHCWPNTEAVYENLYDQAALRQPVDERHRIWVTALIHKEAFFLLPSMQKVFDTHPNAPLLDDTTLDLGDLYERALHALDPASPTLDRDLLEHFPVAQRRLQHFGALRSLDLTSIDTLRDSWQAAFAGQRLADAKTEQIGRGAMVGDQGQAPLEGDRPPAGWQLHQ